MQRLRSVLRAAIPLTLLAIACSGEHRPAAGLMVALDTDLVVPTGINEVGLYVEHIKDGVRKLVLAQEAKPLLDAQGRYTVQFTATLAIEAGEDPQSDRIRARFIGFDGAGAAVAMREARVQVPATDLRRLSLPLRYINEGSVQDTQSTSQALGIRQAQEGGDVFTRYRHPSCGVDETLGDDGECTTIDVDVDSLPLEADFVPSATCMDTAACFGEGRGVRELALQGCQVTVPDHTATTVALAIPAPGYPTGRTALPSAQPIDSGLYTYANGVITLAPALCRHTTRDAVTTVLVSAKCAPRAPSTPICADWQQVKGAAPETEDRFVDDPPTPDASVDAAADAGEDADSSLQEPDAGDSGDGGDGGAQEGFDREITIPAGYDTLESFAATSTGETWLALTGASTELRMVPEGFGTTAAGAAFATTIDKLYLELDEAKNAYLIPGPTASDRNAAVLRHQNPAVLPLQLGNCAQATTDTTFFTVGKLGAQTIGVFATGSGLVSGALADLANPECFPTAHASSQSFTYLERGGAMAGNWYLPLVHANDLLFVDPNDDGLVGTSPLVPARASAAALQSFIDIGNDEALVTGRSLNGSSYDGVFYRAALVDGKPMVDDLIPVRPYPSFVWMQREVFGAQGVACARMLSGISPGFFRGLSCIVRDGAGFTAVEDLNLGAEVDIHVYGDATYVYFAKLCYKDAATGNDKVRVVATPWSKVTLATFADVQFGCPSLD